MSISILIPAYNASAFIAATIKSALAQTLPADDILVVDDGSTDDTAAIAASFPAPVRVLSIPNSKLGAARNFGISQIKTEWIAFLDADDLWEPNKLELQMAELDQHPEADVCYTGHLQFTVGPNGMTLLSPPPEWCPPELVRQGLYRGCPFQPSSVIIRTSVLVNAGCFSPDPGIAEDWDLWLRLIHSGIQFAGCPMPLLLYRQHSGSITAQTYNSIVKNTRTYREHILPRLTRESKTAARRDLSYRGAAAAFYLRDRRDARWCRVMVISIIQWPFGRLGRYRAILQPLWREILRLGRRQNEAD